MLKHLGIELCAYILKQKLKNKTNFHYFSWQLFDMLGVFNKLLKDEDDKRWLLNKLLSSNVVVEIYVTEQFTGKKCVSYHVLNSYEVDRRSRLVTISVKKKY